MPQLHSQRMQAVWLPAVRPPRVGVAASSPCGPRRLLVLVHRCSIVVTASPPSGSSPDGNPTAFRHATWVASSAEPGVWQRSQARATRDP